MGVMACDRRDCENIMCDTCIDGRWYICRECQEEFKLYLEQIDQNPTCEGEIILALELFMTTKKDQYRKGNDISVDEFFRKNTRD
jgi:hypothetical protein